MAPDRTDQSRSESRTRIVRMRHVDLPKLEEYSLIEWNRENDEISKGPTFDEIRPLLALIHDREAELPPG